MGDERLCWWEVNAGFKPGEPARRFFQCFEIGADDWSGDSSTGSRLRRARQQEALDYAANLMSDEAIAWVNLTYESPHAPWIDR